MWAVPAAVAALVWLPRCAGPESTKPTHPLRSSPDAVSPRALLRDPLARQVTLFFALQSAGFYATLAWLPTIFRSHGASEAHAGFLLSLSLIVGVVVALGLPGVAGRVRDQRGLAAASCALTAAGLGGILLAPTFSPYLWTVLLGLGQNAAFSLALMLIVLRGGSVAGTQGLSTLAQSAGYLIAAPAPLIVGTLHGLTGSWDAPLVLLLALAAAQIGYGVAAGRDRRLACDPAA